MIKTEIVLGMTDAFFGTGESSAESRGVTAANEGQSHHEQVILEVKILKEREKGRGMPCVQRRLICGSVCRRLSWLIREELAHCGKRLPYANVKKPAEQKLEGKPASRCS